MANFSYTVIDKTGKKIKGSTDSPNRISLVEYLQSKGYTVLTIREDFSVSFKKLINLEVGGYSLKDKVLVVKQLSTMITAGIPIIQAVRILEEQAPKPSLKDKLNNVFKKIESGSTLSEAFKAESGIFNEVQINLIFAGEKSGRLNEVLIKIADDLEQRKKLQGKISGAMIYPIIVFCLMILIVSVLVVFMVPQVRELYSSFGQKDLPLVTEFLVKLSDFLSNPITFITLPIFIFSLYISFKIFISKAEGRLVIDKMKLKLPVFGDLISKVQVVEFCRLMSLLLQSGVPIIETTKIVANSLENELFRSILQKAEEDLRNGSSISLSIAKNNKNNTYPLILLKVIGTAEESGNVDLVLNDMYKFYNNEVEQTTENLTKAMEPLILVIVGLMVGFLAIAIYLPLYQITNFV